VENTAPRSDFENQVEYPEFNLKELIWKYLVKWPWIVGGAVLAVLSCHFYLKYTPTKYEASSTVLIKDESKGKSIDEISVFEDLGLISNGNKLENEIEILKSRTLMNRVVEELGLNVSYFVEHSPLDLELYTDAPFLLQVLPNDTFFENNTLSAEVIYKSGNTYDLLAEGKLAKSTFGTPVNLGKAKFQLKKQNVEGKTNFGKIRLAVKPTHIVAAEFAERLKVEAVNVKSNVIRITLRDPIKKRATDILNSLIKQYREDAIEDKNQVSLNTSEFINERIKYITAELSDVEAVAEEYKTRLNLVDIPSETEIDLASESKIEQEIIQTNIQLQLSRFVYNYLNKSIDNNDLLPANLGLTDDAVVNMINEHNKHVLNRNRIEKNSSASNPLAVSLEGQIASLRQSIKAALENLISTYELKEATLNKQDSKINSRISTFPKKERELREIQRQQQIKESLYLYLLQKREETAIALAVTVSNAKVIDAAYSSGKIVSPNRKLYFGLAFFFGVFIPVVVIYILSLFNTKVRNKEALNKLNIPFLGEIPNARAVHKLAVKQNDKSQLSEAFRSIRTNIAFILDHKKSDGQILFVTSTLAREGKTFVAINLAAIFAASGKKVLLLGLDLRRQKLLEYLGLPHCKGLTNYLIDSQSAVDDFIFPMKEFDNLFVLPAGDIPPNPAELLMSERVGEVLETLRSCYDYIIVDTAPSGLVTDTLLVAQYADAVIYLVRAGYTDKGTLHIPESFHRDKKLPNMALLLNDASKSAGYGYSYAYSYSYEENEKPFWRRILRLN
jgi:tyrosine-protein kinase Etk/Wzc